MTDKKAILRKYFHGLTDEQFAEQVSEWPLNNIFGAMDEHTLQVVREAVVEAMSTMKIRSDIHPNHHYIAKRELERLLWNIESKLGES